MFCVTGYSLMLSSITLMVYMSVEQTFSLGRWTCKRHLLSTFLDEKEIASRLAVSEKIGEEDLRVNLD